MPQVAMNVPVNGDGADSVLNLYGFNKTFISSGVGGPIDGFEALIMLGSSAAPEDAVPVGRMKGSCTVVIPVWGNEFYLHRLDDGANAPFPAQVTVQAEESTLPMVVHESHLQPAPGTVEDAVDVRDLREPFTLAMHVRHQIRATVMVFGRSLAGDLAPIGRIGQGEFITIDGGLDINYLVLRLLEYDDSLEPGAGSDVVCQIYGKDLALDSGKAAALCILECGNGAGGIVKQGASTLYGFSGVVTNPGVGVYEATLNRSLAGVNPMVFASVMSGQGPYQTTNVKAMLAPSEDAVRVELYDNAGAPLNPGVGVRISIRVDV